jgi:hypothetical protein
MTQSIWSCSIAKTESIIRFLILLNKHMGWRRMPRKLEKSNYNSSTQEGKYERL